MSDPSKTGFKATWLPGINCDIELIHPNVDHNDVAPG